MRFPRSSSIRTEGRRSFIYDLTNWSAVIAEGTHSRVSLARLPLGSLDFEHESNANGERLWLTPNVFNCLHGRRDSGISYRDVILKCPTSAPLRRT